MCFTNILLLAASAPVILCLLWVQSRDRLKEPPKVVWLTVLFGGLMVIPIMIVGLLFVWLTGVDDEVRSYSDAAIMSFVVAALVEEVGKFLVLWFYCARHSAFDEPIDGIVYGVAASLGFALVENVMYVFGNEQSMAVAAMRAFTAVPLHAFCGVIMGTCIGIAKFQRRQRAVWIVLGLAGAIALHGFYDFGLFSAEYGASIEHASGVAIGALGGISTLLLAAVISLLAIARLRRDQELAMGSAASPATVDSAEPSWIDPAVRPNVKVSAPRLPMVAILTAGAASACLVVMFVFCVAIAVEQEAGQDASGLETLAGVCFLATLGLALAGGVVSVVALVREPRWIAASISGLVINLILLLVSLGLIVVGLLGSSAAPPIALLHSLRD